MATDKNSFILYADILHTVEHLPDDKAGLLFKHILRYVNDLNPETDDIVIKLAFEPIKQSLKRDLRAWEEIRIDRSNSGRLGGIKSGQVRRKLKQNEANEASASKSKQKKANEAVSVSVSVSDSVSGINTFIKPDKKFKLDLPDEKINAAIEYVSLTKNVKADRALILSLWKVFKEKNFTGENSYNSESKIFTHFFQSLKYENLNGTHKQVAGRSTGKSTGAEQLLDELKRTTGIGDHTD